MDMHPCVRSAGNGTQTTPMQLSVFKACRQLRRVNIGKGEPEVAAGLVHMQAARFRFSEFEWWARKRRGRGDNKVPLAGNMPRRCQRIADAANPFEAHDYEYQHSEVEKG